MLKEALLDRENHAVHKKKKYLLTAIAMITIASLLGFYLVNHVPD
jgi:hypothetical protein